MVEREDPVELATTGAQKQRVRTLGTAHVEAHLPGTTNRRRHDVVVLGSEQPAFTGMGVEPGDGDANPLRQAGAHADQRIDDGVLAQLIEGLAERHVGAEQRDLQVVPEEGHEVVPAVAQRAARGPFAQLGQRVGVPAKVLVDVLGDDEIRGAATPDGSKKRRDARLLPSAATGPQLGQGKHGKALTFDGVDDALEIRGLPWAKDGAFSLSFWFRGKVRGQSGYQYLASVGQFGAPQTLHVWVAEATKTLRSDLVWANDLSAADPLDVQFDVLDDRWHHYALVARRGGLCEVWLDGKRHAITQLAGTRFTPIAPLIVGQRENFDRTRAFRGAIDELRIVNRAISESEIAALYRWRAGSIVERGPGCRGSRGVPTLRVLGDGELGSRHDFALASGVPNGLAILALGGSDSAWAGIRLPLGLDRAGAIGCSLRVSIDFSVPLPLDKSGASSLRWDSPFDPSLVGARLHVQGISIDRAANKLGMSFTDAERVEFGGLR